MLRSLPLITTLLCLLAIPLGSAATDQPAPAPGEEATPQGEREPEPSSEDATEQDPPADDDAEPECD